MAKAAKVKVLFLAMDAGDTLLIRKWAADGTLPTLGKLLDTGLVGATRSLDGFFEGSTWPSFYTGVTPARHGFHRLVQLRPGTYDFYRCYTGEFIKREPFWNLLSDAGRKVGILDVPLSGISKKIKGMQVVEWGGHDPVYGFRTWPRSVKREILKRFGEYPVRQSCDSFSRSPAGLATLNEQLLEGVRLKAKLTRHYLGQEDWDFFGQVFTESHCVGHQCWHLHDRSHPSHDPDVTGLTGDPIRDVYAAIDGALGEILAAVDGETMVVFLASHRMAHNYGAQFLLPTVLQRLGLCQAAASSPATDPHSVDRVNSVLAWSWHHLPDVLKESVKPVRDTLRGLLDGYRPVRPASLAGIDLKNSRCFPLDNGFSVGGIRINVAGREPEGIVQPADVESFCRQVTSQLLEITDGATGEPVIKKVTRTRELYQGEYLDHLPDLLVQWRDDKAVGSTGTGNPAGSRVRLVSQAIGTIEGVNTYCRTGDHRPEGLFVAAGGGIRPGRLERSVSLLDFAPTFARMLGVEMPDCDGTPIPELVAAGSS